MNFFQHQDLARRSTLRLIIFFLLAVVSLAVLTNVLVMVAFGFINTDALSSNIELQQFDWATFWKILVVICSIIAISSVYKIISLAGGGARVAEMMGAELIVDGSDDINKQKILNVVEEMALASGTPVPPVYLMQEDAINAFAAGYQPGDAVIGVTRGCIEKLSREQLQGVVAHEFSHILNGDMRINIRLIGILHGILIIGMIGYFMLRTGAHSSGGSKRDGGGIVLLGAGLMAIGYAGTFFGNLIKSAVSRQREYLADASAVQFTRDPNSIAGALKKIGGSVNGTVLKNPHASEISHTLFCQGITTHFNNLFATHPPLQSRIKRVDPNWDGAYDFDEVIEQATQDRSQQEEARNKKQTLASVILASAALEQSAQGDHIGNPSEQHFEQAREVLSHLPKILLNAAHEPHGACALIHFLVLDKNIEIKDKQLHYLMIHANPGVYKEIKKMSSQVSELVPEYKLPLVDLALSALRQLSQQQYTLFKNNLVAMVEMDSRMSLFEWALQKIVFHHLDGVFEKRPLQKFRHTTLANSQHACSILLSALAWSGKQDSIDEQTAFNAASTHLDKINIKLLDKKSLSLQKLNQAVDELARLKPLQKPKLLQACAACILADNTITQLEAELFRAFANTLDCPMPPLMVSE